MAPSEQGAPEGGSPADKRIAAPSVSLPKGGGALRGIGETFAVTGATGTAGLQIPLPLTPGRAGWGPTLALGYDSGAGNGPFGLGWGLDLPAISRKTDTGLPRYLDGDESDVFLLSGAEDLVPALAEDARGDWAPVRVPERTVGGRRYSITRYRPRVEDDFARIERWTGLSDGTTHWRTISGDNITTLYGVDDDSRIQDPDPPRGTPPRVLTWLISESRDDKGNLVRYQYRGEDDAGIDADAAHEQSRLPAARTAQRYLKRVLYGNRTSTLATRDSAPEEWMFEAVFDYGEHDEADPQPTGGGVWPARKDPFSSCRAGFEVRTYRLCRRVLMLHHFPGEPTAGRDCLVRSLDLKYDETPVASLLVSVTQRGYRRTPQGLLSRSLPPLELDYSPISLGASSDVHRLDGDGLVPPVGADDTACEWVDLDGEGIPGVLVGMDGGSYYAPNRGGGRLAAPMPLAAVPSAATAGERGPLLDLAGDGLLDLVELGGPTPGFFKRIPHVGWAPFRTFTHLPAVGWADGTIRFTDLNGDGHADVLVSQGDALTWYPSAGEAGFGPAVRLPIGTADDPGPALVFADAENAVFLADMTGDGLADLVRVRHDEVRYWPNHGYGRFGRPVAMDDPPLLDRPDLFDPRRVLLADLDGAGPHDLLYVGTSGTRVYVNQSGNRWAGHVNLPAAPAAARLEAVDLLGTGTPCLVWSPPGPGGERSAVRYLELMPRGKPHLLTGIRNNLGAETVIGYTSSTAFYLADQAEGRPWATHLPFPVHVVSRVDTVDYVSRNRFTTRYAYHHGHFDGAEREFRGFARVDQWDTEQFAALSDSDAVPATWPELVNLDAASHTPPTRTTTWYHTGAFADADELSAVLAGEYYREGDADRQLPGFTDTELVAILRPDRPPPPQLLRPDGSRSPRSLSADEAREACRAMRGAVLRREVYAEDGTDAADRPYTVEEFSYAVELLQPRGENRHASFLRHPREAVTLHYERMLREVGGKVVADPHIRHEMVLSVDGFGNVVRSASIAYGRRHHDADPRLTEADHAVQRRPSIQLTERTHTTPVDQDDAWRTPLPCDTRAYELHGYALPAPDFAAPLVAPELLAEQWAALGDADLPYHDVTGTSGGPGPHRRLIAHERTLFHRDDLRGPEPLGVSGTRALPYEDYRLAFTPELLASVYQRDAEPLLADPATALAAAGYRESSALRGARGFPDLDPPGLWWAPSGTLGYRSAPGGSELNEAQEHFFVPRNYTDPFGAVTSVVYDEDDLLVRETSDARGNRITAGERRPRGTVWRNDYRVLAPAVVTDPNGNRDAVAFDTLGMVAGTAVMGKIDAAGADEDIGDTLEGFESDLSENDVREHLRNPTGAPLDILSGATTRLVYDLDAFQRWWRNTNDHKVGGPPSAVLALARERHLLGPDGTPTPRVSATLTYADGLGREIARMAHVDAGPLTDGGPDAPERWVGTGWTVFDNKGREVRQYEPYFTDTAAFTFGNVRGVSSVLFRDPLGRVVATLHPDHTWTKTVFDPWRQTAHDVGDTVDVDDPGADPDVGAYFSRVQREEYLPTWLNSRLAGPPSPQSKAAKQSRVYADTPTTAFTDSLGATFLTLAVNRHVHDGATTTEQHTSHVYRDIQGNEREVHDAHRRLVMRYEYDMLGNRIHGAGMDSGSRWSLNDCEGEPVHTWNTLCNDLRITYDELRRPTGVFLHRAGAPAEVMAELTRYGDDPGHPGGAAAAEAANLRGQVHQAFDGAGAVTYAQYDFTGNLVRSERRLAADYRGTPDWSRPPKWDGPAFGTETRHDALGRPIAITLPDGTRLTPRYNDAGQLESVGAHVRGAPAETLFVTKIAYDAKGRRARITYGNGVRTEYRYDPLTFRLTRLHTVREGFPDDCPTPGEKPCGVQYLSYTYDAAGNITHIRDDAQQAVFFRNQRIEPGLRYVYDAVYRLIEATGREHLGQTADPVPSSWTDAPRTGQIHPGDGKAMGSYRERYTYDAVGNLRGLEHQSTDVHGGHRGWTRTYEYRERSALEPATVGNRLSTTDIGGVRESFAYDAHGNTTAMPHTTLMRWDHRDRLAATSTQAVNSGTPETTYYVYDASGQRVRKVTERFAAEGGTPTRLRERIYLDAVEVYREYGPDGTTVTLERETLHVMDDAAQVTLVETRTKGTDNGPERLTRYQLADHLGSAAVELDDRARVISYEEYHPYGSTAYQAVAAAVQAPKRYRFTGKERDEESGLSYHSARYYAPWLGRWTSCDPAGLVDGPNLYAYAGCDPCGLIDPDGRASAKHKLNDVVTYRTKLKKRSTIGKNVQKDHIISQGKMKLMRTDPKGRVHYNPRKDPTVLVETGKATKAAPAKPHTVKTSHGPLSDVEQLKKLKKEGMGNSAKDIVDPSRQAALNAGYKQTSVDKAIWGQLDELHGSQSLQETAAELKRLEAAEREAKLAKDALTAGKGAAKAGSKELLSEGAKVGVKQGAKWVGKKALKLVPGVGVAVGIGLVSTDVKAGDYKAAAWDAAEAVPVVGDVVAAGHMGMEAGAAADASLGISQIAAEHGEAARQAVARLTGSKEGTAFVTGGVVAAASAITFAPGMALTDAVGNWIKSK